MSVLLYQSMRRHTSADRKDGKAVLVLKLCKGSSTNSLPRHQQEVSGQLHAPSAVSPGKNPQPIEQEAGWSPEPLQMCWEEKHLFPLPGFETCIVQPVAQSLPTTLTRFPRRAQFSKLCEVLCCLTELTAEQNMRIALLFVLGITGHGCCCFILRTAQLQPSQQACRLPQFSMPCSVRDICNQCSCDMEEICMQFVLRRSQ